jgi:hypothetical protein
VKRLLLIALLLPGAAFAFDRAPGKDRIGILQRSDARHSYVQRCVLDSLQRELRQRGFDVYLERATFDELSLDPDRDADYYIDVVGDGETEDWGGVDIGGRHGDVSIGVLASHVAAEVRIYEGRTLQVLATKSMSKHSTAVVPTSIGVGGRDLFAVFALPFLERAQVRSVARAAAKQMAENVTSAVREK